MLRRVRPGYQILHRNGCLFAGSGEVFDDQHQAAQACPNIETISTPEVAAEPVAAPAPIAPAVEEWAVTDEDAGPGDEAEDGETP